MVFRLSEFGQVFSTRPRGLEMREALLERLPPGESVAVSFNSVLRVSQSFSDEFLGALVSELGAERVSIDGAMVLAVERVLKRALRHRGVGGLEELGAIAA